MGSSGAGDTGGKSGRSPLRSRLDFGMAPPCFEAPFSALRGLLGTPAGWPARCLRSPAGAHAGFSHRQGRGQPRGVKVPAAPGSRPAAAMAAGLWVLLLLPPLTAAVYEDQVGKFDW